MEITQLNYGSIIVDDTVITVGRLESTQHRSVLRLYNHRVLTKKNYSVKNNKGLVQKIVRAAKYPNSKLKVSGERAAVVRTFLVCPQYHS